MKKRKKYSVVCFFAREHGLNALAHLLKDETYECKCVFTHSKKATFEDKFRRERPDFEKYKEICFKNNIPLYAIDSKADLKIVENVLKELGSFDLLLVLSWRMLIPANEVHMPNIIGINIHRGKLLEYAGNFPIVRALENNEKLVYITAQQLDEEIDGGRIIKEVPFPVNYQHEKTLDKNVKRIKRELTPHFGGLLMDSLKIVINEHEKKNKVIFIFDFDGVVVDSVSFLYEIYTNFLKEFGINGNQEEFNLLNGPKLSEIVSFLKNKYHIQKDKNELIEIYQNKIASIYKNIKLNADVENILKWLKHKNITITLASSSKKEEILSVLKRYDLEQYFNFIITGDDVKEAKPSPEIYNAVRNKYPNSEYYVIEDSENGLNAAKDAGMKTLFYNPKEYQIKMESTYTIHSLLQIKNIITEIELNCFTIAKADNISLKVIEYKPEINSSQKEAVETLWNDELKKRKLFNGKIVSYKSHKKNDNMIEIECFITQYKYFFAQLRNPQLKMKITPIGVSGIIIDEENNTLLAIRQNVTEYNGYYELIPAGSIDLSKRAGSNILFQNQLITEFEEETRISKDNIKEIEPFCLIFDKNHGVYDICSKIHIDGLIKNKLNTEQNEEYRNIEIMNLKEIKIIIPNKFVPTSIIIYNNLE